jgi:uncharacterized Zn ribbon protein
MEAQVQSKPKYSEPNYRNLVLCKETIKASAQCVCKMSQNTYRCPNDFQCYNKFRQGDVVIAIRDLRLKFFPQEGSLTGRRGSYE